MHNINPEYNFSEKFSYINTLVKELEGYIKNYKDAQAIIDEHKTGSKVIDAGQISPGYLKKFHARYEIYEESVRWYQSEYTKLGTAAKAFSEVILKTKKDFGVKVIAGLVMMGGAWAFNSLNAKDKFSA